jgi:hypothetical protein
MLCLAFLLALPGGAQLQLGTQQYPGNTPRFGRPDPSKQAGGPSDDLGDMGSSDQDRRLRALNIERQKAMVSDAKKLLKLANELNADVTSTQPNELGPDQLQKLAEIEKLARSVKEKMSTSVKGQPVYQPPGAFPQ